MSRAQYDTIINRYRQVIPGTIGPLIDSFPGRFVVAAKMTDSTPVGVSSEFYATFDPRIMNVPFWKPQLPFQVKAWEYGNSDILEDSGLLGVYYLVWRVTPVFVPVPYLQAHLLSWPLP